ncbi:MAG: hypothetical protein GY856_31210 [bacterium]|nr:hypothetical protein [bacterium]
MALKYLRDNLKSLKWILWAVVAVFVLLVFFGWGGYNQRRETRSDAAATVGDETITYDEFHQQYRRLEDYYKQTFGEQFTPELAKRFNLPVQALNMLINQKILLMEAREVGLRVTDAELREEILSYPVFQDDNGAFVGQEDYRQRVRRMFRRSVKEFEAVVRQDILIAKIDSVLAETIYISDAEVEEAYREQTERAKIRFLQLPGSELSDQVTVGQAAIEAYFADHRSDYELPEQRVADYLLVDTVKLRQEIEIPEEELRAFYDDHPDDFTREEQVRARHILRKVSPVRPELEVESEVLDIRRRIEAGEDFAALAQELSEDEVSARRGGSLGAFGRGQMVPAFEEAAFTAVIGELVGPVRTDFGYHLIEVQGHTMGGLQPFEQVQAAVRARLVNERVNEIAEDKARDLAQRIAGEELTTEDQLRALAEEEGLTLETTEPFGRGDNVAGIGRAIEFTAAAFELEPDAVSEAIKVPRGWAILRLKEVRELRLQELAEVEDEVRQAVELAQQKRAALTRLEETRKAIEEGGSIEALAAELGLDLQESSELTRRGSIAELGPSREVIDAALELEVGQLGGPFESAQGAVLFEVLERKKFDAAEFEEAKASTRASEETQRINQLKSSLVELRRRDTPPTYDPKVMELFEVEAPGQG